MTLKSLDEILQNEIDDNFLSDQIKELDNELKITLEDANRFLNFILNYGSKLTEIESRLLQIRSLIEAGKFDKKSRN